MGVKRGLLLWAKDINYKRLKTKRSERCLDQRKIEKLRV